MQARRWQTLLVVLLGLCGSAAQAGVAPPMAGAVPGEVIVRYRPGTRGRAARAQVRQQLGRDGGIEALDLVHGELLRFANLSTMQAIDALRRAPGIEYAEPNLTWRVAAVPDDPRFPEQEPLLNTGQAGGTPGADLRATAAWDTFTGDSTLLVGVIDTGIDLAHPDLAGNLWTNPGEIPGNGIDDDGDGYIDDVHGFNFVAENGDPADDNGHGTHCAGTIGARGDNGLGIAGVNWRCRLVAIKFLDASGMGTTAGAIRSLEYARAIGCRLTSNSWGGGTFSQALLDAIEAAGAAGGLFVAAAGNAGADLDQSPSYPAAYETPYVVSVAATDHDDQLASFSNHGATSVDLAAPGVNVLSCRSGGGYQSMSGTSMAAPFVTGAAALAWGRYPAEDNLQIRQLVLSATDPFPALSGRCVSGGRLDLAKLFSQLDTIPPARIADLATGAAGSTTLELAWSAPGDDGGLGQASRYDLRWSRSPIGPGSFASATPVAVPAPGPPGSIQRFEVGGLHASTGYYFAIEALDEFGNAGPPSNGAMGTTLGAAVMATAPTALNETLPTGGSAERTLVVANAGAGRLDFTVPSPEIVLPPAGPLAATVYAPSAAAKGARDGGPAVLGAGGPDAFGYRWTDSDEAGGPAFQWIELAGSGTPLGLTGDDATSAAVPLGFPFRYYGRSFDRVFIGTNGTLSFSDDAHPYANTPLPGAGGPANLLAPWWDDQDFGGTNCVTTSTDGNQFVAEFRNVLSYAGGGPYTYEVILQRTGEIRFQYLSMSAPRTSGTIGIQDSTRTTGLTVAANTDYVHAGLAIRIIPLGQWLAVTPAAGHLPAGASMALAVRFDAANLPGGNYVANLKLPSNESGAPHLVPVALRVIGAASARFSPDTVAFGVRYSGGIATGQVRVDNPGTDTLHVRVVSIAGSGLAAAPAVLAVGPGGTGAVTLSWQPATPCSLDGRLELACDDPAHAAWTSVVLGEAIAPPDFTVTPAALDESLAAGAAGQQIVRVENHGGSDLSVAAAPFVPLAPGALAPAAGRPGAAGTAPARPAAGGPAAAPGAGAGSPAPFATGGPDAAGYRWLDSRSAGGPAYAWIELAGTGQAVPLAGDDSLSARLPIGFAFPFYGRSFDSLSVCTNGWLSFTSRLTSFANTPLPAAIAPANLLAVFWDDLEFTPASHVFARNDGSRLVVEFQDVPRRGESGHPNTFEVILEPDGRIDYQYASMSTPTPASATVGVQNGDGSAGLQVVADAPWVSDGLRVEIVPAQRWLGVTPAAGVVSPGGSLDLAVQFDAGALAAGEYAGAIRLTTNDPQAPLLDLAARLHVSGQPGLAASPASLVFDTTFVGFPRIHSLVLRNSGSDALVIDGATSDAAAFLPEFSPLTLAPGGSAAITVRYSPSAAGTDTGTLTIKSNDPSRPFFPLALRGEGAGAPDLVPGLVAVSGRVQAGGAAHASLPIVNPGASNLYWTLTPSVTPAARVAAPPADSLLKGQQDTRPGVLGSGGPDAAGYRWRDSDDPFGPPFAWVELSALGAPVPALHSDDTTVTAVPIGFPFPFYGGSFTRVNVCSNGWLSFTSALDSYANQPLPSAGPGSPENLVAPFWDDLDPGAAGEVYRFGDGSRFIVEWAGVPQYGVLSGTSTFEAILTPDGRMTFQYLSLAGERAGATVGLQNATRDVGLQAVYDAPYLRDSLAIRFARIPAWIGGAPVSGTVPPGGTTTVMLDLGSAGLDPGTYTGRLELASNDPARPLIELPVTLEVTAPGVAAGGELPRRLALRLAGRNPVRGEARLALELPQRTPVDVGVYDVRGARIATLAAGEQAPGVLRLRWDGADRAGREAPAGVYFVRARAAGATLVRRIVRLP